MRLLSPTPLRLVNGIIRSHQLPQISYISRVSNHAYGRKEHAFDLFRLAKCIRTGGGDTSLLFKGWYRVRCDIESSKGNIFKFEELGENEKGNFSTIG